MPKECVKDFSLSEHPIERITIRSHSIHDILAFQLIPDLFFSAFTKSIKAERDPRRTRIHKKSENVSRAFGADPPSLAWSRRRSEIHLKIALGGESEALGLIAPPEMAAP